MTAMTVNKIHIGDTPALLYGAESDRAWLYIHGKSGYKELAEPFARLVCPGDAQVLSIDLPDHGERKGSGGFDPRHVVPELTAVMELMRERYDSISLYATSIGAWFSMLAFPDVPLEKALFVSPVLDMSALIRRMMDWAGVDDAWLEREREISTDFGETLSWDYYQYVKARPIVKWDAPTEILYAGRDDLVERETVDAFAARFGCGVTVMENGEHWFHTPEQLSVLEKWEKAMA